MKGMLVEVKDKKQEEPRLKALYHTCKNCGSEDHVNGSHCSHCRFPFSQSRSKAINSGITTKVKRS